MSRRCQITGKNVQSGNNVSHAINKTRRRFLPNLQSVKIYSDILGNNVTLRLATSTIRTMEVKGGLDNYLMNTPARRLSDDARKLKKRIEKTAEKAKAKKAS